MNNNALGERANFVVGDQTYTQQVVETKCKSPFPSSAEMCIECVRREYSK